MWQRGQGICFPSVWHVLIGSQQHLTSKLVSVERREFDVTSVMQTVCSKLDSSTEGWQMLKIVLNIYSFMKKEAQ